MSSVAFITGAATGIGAAVALALGRQGVATVLAVRNPAQAAPVLEALRAIGTPAVAVACDVTQGESVSAAVRQTLERLGRIDILVNNAGIIEPIGELAATDPQAWARSVQVNLVGPYNVCHAALPPMLEAGGGVVLNLSSGAAHHPRLGWSAYCCGKAGLRMLTQCLHLEYGSGGIAAFGLQPGLVDTRMQERIRESGVNEISRLDRSQLDSPDIPARLIAWFCLNAPEDLRGMDLAAGEPSLRQRAGIPA